MRSLPRISIDQALGAITRYQELAEGDPLTVLDAATKIAWRKWDPSLGIPTIQADEIDAIAAGVRELAKQHGYPNRVGSEELVAFDKVMAESLWRHLDLAPGELGHRTGWMYLSCAVLPDIVAWRYPGVPTERANGGKRDVFRRYAARSLMYRHFENPIDARFWLDEDMMVSLEERPSLGESGVVAAAVIRGAKAGEPPMKSATFRTYYIKRWLRLAALINLDFCTADFMSNLTTELTSDAANRAQPNPNLPQATLDEHPTSIEIVIREHMSMDHPNVNSRGAMIRAARTTAGLRQSDLSAGTGINSATISQIETGNREPSVEEFSLLIAACHAR